MGHPGNTLYKAYQDRPGIFTAIGQPINSQEEFENVFFFGIEDFFETAIHRYHNCFGMMDVMAPNILNLIFQHLHWYSIGVIGRG